MGLFKTFSYNVEIEYKSYLFSKAMVFTLVTTALNIILPLLIAVQSRGFWLKSHYFYEQPLIRSTYDYILFLETNDPSLSVLCTNENSNHHELCKHVQIQEHDHNKDGKYDNIDVKIGLVLPEKHTAVSLILIFSLDFQLMTVCPFQMQSFAIISQEFTAPPSRLRYHGLLQFLQTEHLPCIKHHIDTRFNTSLLYIKDIDSLLETYFNREVTSKVEPIYIRNQHGHTGALDIEVFLKIPEMEILYTPNLLQEIKWAWPQYLSLVIVFYWIFNRIKRFVFSHRLLMAWEIVPWKKSNRTS